MKRWRNVTPIQDGVIRSHQQDFDIAPVLQEYDDEIEKIIGSAQSKIRAAGSIQGVIGNAAGSRGLGTTQKKLPTEGLLTAPVEPIISKYDTGSVDDESMEGSEDDADDDNDEDAISAGRQFLSQAESAAMRALLGIKRQFGNLREQCAEYRKKLQTTSESLSKATEKNAALEFQLTDIAQDLEALKLQNQRKTADSGTNTSVAVKNNSLEANARLKSDQMRKALLLEDNVEVKITMEELLEKGFFVWLYNILAGWILRLVPLKAEIKLIEAKFGSSIMSYFLFKRFILMQFLAVEVVVIVYSALHIRHMIANGHASSVMTRSGIMPGFMFISSYGPSENALYASVVLVIVLVFLISIIDKLVREDRYAKEGVALESENAYPYASEVFCIWDCSQTSRVQCRASSGALAQTYSMMLDKSVREAKIKARSREQLALLWATRSVVMLIYLGIQFVAIVVFLYFSFYADKVIQQTSSSILKPFSNYIQSIAFQIIGTLMPIIAEYASDLEQWDSGHVLLMVSLVRNYGFNTANTILVVVSYLVLADPFLFATTPRIRDISMSLSSKFHCRFDQTGNAIFTLVVTTFASKFLSMVITPLYRYVKSRVFGTAFTLPPFDVAGNMVDTLLFIGVIFILVPFAPLALLLAPLFLYLEIKWQCYCAIHYYRKPKKPWKAHQAMPVFSIFYLISFIMLLLLPAYYFFSSKTFPKVCSLQDRFVNLCSDSVDETTNLCTPNEDSPYYAAYGETSYPASLCKDACGPFVEDSSNFESVKRNIDDIAVLRYIWTILFSKSYFPWIACIILLIIMANISNSYRVSKLTTQSKIKVYEAHIQSLEAEQVLNAKRLSKLQAMERDFV